MTTELNPAAHGSRAGTFAIMVPWLPTPEDGVNQIVINLYKEIARAGPFAPLVIVPDWMFRADASRWLWAVAPYWCACARRPAFQPVTCWPIC
jgi:hypothetical protein